MTCLTPREVEVIEAIIGGGKLREIAAAFHVEITTVEQHARHIREKLEARTMPHAVALYLNARHQAQATAAVMY